MDATGSAEMVGFGEFRLAPRAGGLFRCAGSDSLLPVDIGPRALAVLCVLVGRAGELVPKDEILSAVWPETVVEEANLSVQLSKLRRILDAGSEGGSHIQTVSGRGYRFARPVTGLPPPTRAAVTPQIKSPSDTTTLAAGPTRRLRTASIVCGGVILLMIVTMGVTWRLGHLNPPHTAAYSAQDRRRSVVVLPFDNSSGDPAQDTLAAEITREVTDLIATDAGVPIVSRVPGDMSRQAAVNLHSIGRQYDVHFVLAGHARQQDGHLIVAATVSQTDDERAVWTQRYDSPDSLGAMQSIIQDIGDNFDQATQDAEGRRARTDHPDNMDKRDLLFAANSTSLLEPTRENYLARIAWVDRALTLDPNFEWALRKTAMLHARLVLAGLSTDRNNDLSIAIKAADRALMLAPNDLFALRTKATVLRAQGDYKGAAALFRQLIEIQPMVTENYRQLAKLLTQEGRHAEALETVRIARDRLATPDSGRRLQVDMAAALVANGHYVEAIMPARLATSQLPPETGIEAESAWLALIAAEIESGQEAQGRADLRRFLDTKRRLRNIDEVGKVNDLATNDNLLRGLRQAGMPAN